MSQEEEDLIAKLRQHFAKLDHEARTLAAQREEALRERDDLARQLAELTQLVGTETPIGALDLATSWRAEKAGYMEQVEELTGLARDVCERMAHDDNNVTPDTAAALRALERAVGE